MKKIKLTYGKYALVDDKDFEKVSKHKWYAEFGANTYYAARIAGKRPNRHHLFMHRFILNLSPKDKCRTDHANGKGWDNRQCNLRKCSQSQNLQNRVKRKGQHYSKYKGVSFHKNNGKWVAQIKINGQNIWLGSFGFEKDAAKAYNKAAKRYFEKFALVNKLRRRPCTTKYADTRKHM